MARLGFGVRAREYMESVRRARNAGLMPRTKEGLIDVEAFGIEIEAMIADLRKVMEPIRAPTVKKKILKVAALPTKEKAQSLLLPWEGTPRNVPGFKGAVSVIYNSMPEQGRKRAKKGEGNIIARVFPGNLRRSVQILNLKKAKNKVILGPKITEKISKTNTNIVGIGKSERRASGYYAQMVFGTAEAFRKQIMEAALLATQGEVVRIASQEVDKVIKPVAKAKGFQ